MASACNVFPLSQLPCVNQRPRLRFLPTFNRNTKSFTRTTMVVSANSSRFDNISMAPTDPRRRVCEAFEADSSDVKINLGIRAYRTEDLEPYVLNSVKKAEYMILQKDEDKEYLPIEGLAAFSKVTAELLLGADNPIISQNKIATVQSVSGTGSLRLGFALIERYYPGARVLISSPTWANHMHMLDDSRVPWSEYRYYDQKTEALDLDGMIADIKAAADGSFVLLHGSAHFPTGVDPTVEQWETIADAIQEKNHIAYFDLAYQGFASGNLDEDARAVRLFAARGMELIVAQSYGKNLGLYAERIGAVNVVCSSADAAARVKSQLKRLVRPLYSNPPIHGARIVATVVETPELFSEWKEELALFTGNVKSRRQKLYNSLRENDQSGKDWSFLVKQAGLFSLAGLNKAQVEHITSKWRVYMTEDGMLSFGGLTSAKCGYLADAIIDSFHNIS